ncbi:hypothetical protein [Aeromonas veronii]|nr:hypothetical protein [Aeromonas veronii]
MPAPLIGHPDVQATGQPEASQQQDQGDRPIQPVDVPTCPTDDAPDGLF